MLVGDNGRKARRRGSKSGFIGLLGLLGSIVGNLGDVHEIMKFEKAREVLGSLSCLRLLGSGFKVLGSVEDSSKQYS